MRLGAAPCAAALSRRVSGNHAESRYRHSIAAFSGGASWEISPSLRATMGRESKKTSGTAISVVAELAITSELNER